MSDVRFLAEKESLMKRRHVVLGGAAALAVAPYARVFAHHGWSSFDETAPLYFEGKVKSVKWQNPHVELVVTLDGKAVLPAELAKREIPKQAANVDGAKILANAKLPKRRGDWNIELAPLPRMDAWKVEPLKVGDTFRGIGFTYKDEQGAQVTRIEYLIVGNKTYGLRSAPA
jgi:Family of unknown function (DUF6152)